MVADKDLMPYNLSIVAILKNEGPYLKEWIDYHLLAGVDHFFLYDNDSTDNQKEVVRPYVEAGLVDYAPLPGKKMQMVAYNDAINRFKFFTRYMAFIDSDEFIMPRDNNDITDVIDSVIYGDIGKAGLVINWQCFGSSGHMKADLSKGVLERFTKRAPYNWGYENIGNIHVKTVANPRYINFMEYPHHATFFLDRYPVNEDGKIVLGPFNSPVTIKKIVINHYIIKSKEEFEVKLKRGKADSITSAYSEKIFDQYDQNDITDESILQYRNNRAMVYKKPDGVWAYEKFLFNLPSLLSKLKERKAYINDIETLLTCCFLCNYLKKKVDSAKIAKHYEKECVNAILEKMYDPVGLADLILLIRTMPFLLKLNYPTIDSLRKIVISKIPSLSEICKDGSFWRVYSEINNIRELLKRY